MSQKVNGVDVEALKATLTAIESQPELAQFQFQAENEWITGPVNRTKIEQFHGTCQLHKHAEPFVFDADEPPVLLGEDGNANPVEYLLTALAGCVTYSPAARRASSSASRSRSCAGGRACTKLSASKSGSAESTASTSARAPSGSPIRPRAAAR